MGLDRAVQPAEAQVPTFGAGTTVHWVVDLTSLYPRGVLCSRVQALLFPAVPEQHAERVAAEGVLVAESTSPFPGGSSVPVEVGREYKLQVPLFPATIYAALLRYQSPPLLHGQRRQQGGTARRAFELKLHCLPLQVEGGGDSPTPGPGQRLAVSEPFQLHLPSSLPTISVHVPPATLHDISTWEELEEEGLACPISKDRPVAPVRVAGHVYDRDAFLAYLDLPASRDEERPEPSLRCPLRNPFDRVCLDHQHFYKLQKYAEADLHTWLRERQCRRAQALANANLRTERLYAVDLGLDGEAVHFPDAMRTVDRSHLTAHFGRPGASFLGVMMTSVRETLFTDLCQTIVTLQVLLIYAVLEYSIFAFQPLQGLVRSVREGGGLGALLVCQLFLPGDSLLASITRTAIYLFLYWANILHARSEQSAPSHDMELYVRRFSEAVRALALPPALRDPLCPVASPASRPALE